MAPSLEGSAAPESPVVLLLGEANLSFSLALASLLAQECRPPAAGPPGPAEAYLGLGPRGRQARIVATSFEDEGEVLRKYPEAAGVLARLKSCHGERAEVRHGVNAWDLRASFGEEARWDAVAWNHPHLGTEDCRLHRFLLAHFLAAASAALREGGRVVLSLVEGQAERWELEGQAARVGMRVLARKPLAARDFPGYECKRNTTGRSFKSLHSQRHAADDMRSWTYHLCRAEEGGAPLPSLPAATSQQPSAAPRPGRRARRGGGGAGDADPTSSRPAAPNIACEVCGKAFTCQQGLRTHVRQVHELRKYGDAWQPLAPTERACSECGKAFRDAEALWQHSLAVHAVGAAGAARTSRSGAAAHGVRGPSLVAEQLEGEAASGFVACSICGMAVAKGTPMEKHLEALKPLVELSLSCGCGRAFPEARALEQHRRFCRQATARRGCGQWCERGPWGWLRRLATPW